MGGDTFTVDWGISEKDFFQSKLTPIEWAEKYRVINGLPYSREGYEWVVDIHNSNAPIINVQKAAQLGLTETVINKAFYTIISEKRSVLYLLPTDGDATDFSASRFDPALEESEYLRKAFSDVSNRGLKRAGTASLYVRGSRSKSGLKSVPVSLLIMDEFDEMDMENVALARDRLSGQKHKQEIRISTPTIEGYGINRELLSSKVYEFTIKCIHCNHRQILSWESSVVKNMEDPSKSYLKCTKCGKKWSEMDRRYMISKGKWVATDNRLSDSIAYKINQLYSPTVTVVELVKKYKEAIDKNDEFLLEDFYRSSLGQPYVGERNRLTLDIVNRCISGYNSYDRFEHPTVIGIDVGRVKHYTVLSKSEHPSVIAYGKFMTAEHILELIERYNVSLVVIDSEPVDENIVSLGKEHNKVWLADFVDNFSVITKWMDDEEVKFVKINRNIWIERLFNMVQNKKIQFPYDIDEEFKKHFTKLSKVVRLNKRTGSWRTTWVSSGEDHYLFSTLYALVALEQMRNDDVALENESQIYVSNRILSRNFWRPLTVGEKL